MRDFYQELAEAIQQTSIVLATVTSIKGSVPREVGAKMIVCSDNSIIGTIGGGAGEAKVIRKALEVLETGEKQFVEIDLSGAPHRETQGVCGGTMQVWLERWTTANLSLVDRIIDILSAGNSTILVTPFDQELPPYLEININENERATNLHQDRPNPPDPPSLQGKGGVLLPSPCRRGVGGEVKSSFREVLLPPPTLLIIGAGHVAVPLAQIAHTIGFNIIIQDDRAEFATKERFPQASAILPFPITDYQLPTENLYVALVTRGMQHDLAALRILLKLKVKYIGAIGSLKRIRLVQQELQQEGYPESALKSIYAPIGLDIGALTPEEIAVSICAELIKVRRGGNGRSLSEQIRFIN
ncbi:XdhC family protein [Argonema galeatum]|uniref:XdhC family protein n=1 Tax=Argonema galeatum TaxID=2942762 RepID=UPI00201383A2|nr:XdhC/CoxI family protein [Argonema galeatum]MCL1463229.1 XdhC family protein [Argonema galeatum A003/A1]